MQASDWRIRKHCCSARTSEVNTRIFPHNRSFDFVLSHLVGEIDFCARIKEKCSPDCLCPLRKPQPNNSRRHRRWAKQRFQLENRILSIFFCGVRLLRKSLRKNHVWTLVDHVTKERRTTTCSIRAIVYVTASENILLIFDDWMMCWTSIEMIRFFS